MLSPEEFCDDVKQALLDNIAAALAAQTAKWAAADEAAGRNVPLVAPADEDYYVGGVPTVVTYPTIEVAVSDLTLGGFSIENFDADAQPMLHVRAKFEQPNSPEELYRMGCRWFAAIVAVLTDPLAIPTMGIDGLSGHWRFDPRANQADQVRSGVLVTFNLAGPLLSFVA